MTSKVLRRRAALLSMSSYFATALVLGAVLTSFIGVLAAVQLLIALFLLATLPGAAIVRRTFAKPGLARLIVIGTVLGLALWALGGMLSHLTGLVIVRWIPALFAAVLWIVPRSKSSIPRGHEALTFPATGLFGAVLGLVALFPLTLGVLRSTPVSWTGWYHFYTDLPFHIAITSEVAARAPEQTSWVANNVLNYTWLFHSAMGVWGSATNVSSADIVLQAWPVLYAVTMPALIAIVAWEITHSRFIAFAAPLIYVLTQGLVFMPEEFHQIPVFQISPTRDFANLFVLLTVLALTRLLGKGSLRSANSWWFAVLGISVFVATGAKGSPMPILLGGVLCAGLYLVMVRKVSRADFAVLGVFAVSAATSYFLVLPDPRVSEALGWGPLTFLSADTPNRSMLSLMILALLAFSILGMFVTIGKSSSGGWLLSCLLNGVLFAGLLGLGLLTHPGFSQVYFWQSAQPILAISLAWSGAILFQKFGWKFASVAFVVFMLANAVWIGTHRALLTGLAILLLSAAAAVFFGRDKRELAGSSRVRSLLTQAVLLLAFAGVVVQTAQFVTIPAATPGGMASTASDPGAINSSQLAAFLYIRAHSQPQDLVVTNKHCVGGSLAEGNCDGRWFALAAWSERRVLVDGWGYTQNGTTGGWVSKQLKLSDDFIASPTTKEKAALVKLGVHYAYVDAREPHGDLSSVGTLVFHSRWASVYSLIR